MSNKEDRADVTGECLRLKVASTEGRLDYRSESQLRAGETCRLGCPHPGTCQAEVRDQIQARQCPPRQLGLAHTLCGQWPGGVASSVVVLGLAMS